MSLPPIVFGTDGWRGQIARDLTFASVQRVVDAAGAWNVSPENTDPGDPWTVPLVHDTRFLSPEFAAESAARLASQGFRVLLTDRPVPTPSASWNGVKVKSWFGGSATPATYAAVARSADRPLPGRAGGAVEKVDLHAGYRDAIAARVDRDAVR